MTRPAEGVGKNTGSKKEYQYKKKRTTVVLDKGWQNP